MGIDTILHLLFGGIIAAILFSARVHGVVILFVIAVIAGSKELLDHYFILGHCYPECMEEHIEDFLASFIMFFISLPMIAVIQAGDKRSKIGLEISICAAAILIQMITLQSLKISQENQLLALNDKKCQSVI